MKSIFLRSTGILFIFLWTSIQVFGQDDRYHSIVAQTQAFSAEELQALKDYLKEEHGFLVPGGCRETGLVLVEYPASASLRVGTAETMILAAIEKIWHEGATIARDLPREEILSCIED